MGAVKMRTLDLPSAEGRCDLLTDIDPWPVGKLERFNITGRNVEKRGKTHGRILEFANAASQEILFLTESTVRNARNIESALYFLLRINSNSDEFPTAEFLLDTRKNDTRLLFQRQ